MLSAAVELAHLFVDVGPLTIIINNDGDGDGIRNNSNRPPHPPTQCMHITHRKQRGLQGRGCDGA